jgi:hypothetical protein
MTVEYQPRHVKNSLAFNAQRCLDYNKYSQAIQPVNSPTTSHRNAILAEQWKEEKSQDSADPTKSRPLSLPARPGGRHNSV